MKEEEAERSLTAPQSQGAGQGGGGVPCRSTKVLQIAPFEEEVKDKEAIQEEEVKEEARQEGAAVEGEEEVSDTLHCCCMQHCGGLTAQRREELFPLAMDHGFPCIAIA